MTVVQPTVESKPKKQPFDWSFSLKLGWFFLLSRLSFLHWLLPESIRDELPIGWNFKMFWTAFSTGGNKIYYDLYCRTKEPPTFAPKVKTKPEFQLTEADIKFFHDNGYIGPFDLLSPEETQELRDYCFKVVDSESQVYSFSKGEYSFQEGKRKNALLGGYDKLTEENKKYFSGRLNLMDRHLDSPKLLQLLKRPEIVERCAQILGENLIVWRSQFFTKTPRKPGTTWHQANVWLFDNFKEPVAHPVDIEEISQLTCWIAITDVNKENGCMKIIPGSHKEIYPINIDRSENVNNIYGFIGGTMDYPTESAPVDYIEMKAGQFYFFSERAIHGAVENKTDQSGLALNCRITRTDTRIHNQKVLKKGSYSIDIFGIDHSLNNWSAVLLRGEDKHGYNRLYEQKES
ncbi:MAG: phytanoyl-CoA dioxygenase family protein [Jaaginema sp. PMC 1079.18]|nr:phytanoyl-CoA dioxygenase family protein [Jaaginema sp. PMC 1080.18]MEC4850601.1 phytanoyl-CoA dioxygenase family protein [Jaaginema sp. PMC 1079.18]MEC4865380.1 phytanoyl-CoA dioxygenase family protein [Jaaginema sp. PMC 1078.18]